MLSKERKFHYIGQVVMNKSDIIKNNIFPREDIVNWLFLEVSNKRFSFIYDIVNPDTAEYNVPFKILISVIMHEQIKNIIELNMNYPIYRGEEKIGYLLIEEYI